jgi:hypothetical protein
MAIKRASKIVILLIGGLLSDHHRRRAPTGTELLLTIRAQPRSGRPTQRAAKHAMPFVAMAVGDLRRGALGQRLQAHTTRDPSRAALHSRAQHDGKACEVYRTGGSRLRNIRPAW